MLPSHTRAQAGDILQISEPTFTVNRDPSISDSGLVAWMYFSSTDTNKQDSTSSDSFISVYDAGKLFRLTEEAPALFGATKPLVVGDQVLFVANARTSEGDESWVLKEVTERDQGDIKELPANYAAFEEDGIQRFELQGGTNFMSDATNATESSSVTTNAARRHPSGRNEIWSWRKGNDAIQRVTNDGRNDFAPSFWGDIISWQKAKGWPFGWEIMALVGDTRMQLTTNYYYDMGPKVHGENIVWYGWDGFDYEIYLFDAATTSTVQITSNRYDDVAPAIWDGVVVWEGYSAVEADIYMWRKGEITKISNNLDDDLYPRIWKNKVVWQGFDGDDFEIYAYDTEKGGTPVKLTTNNYDDTNPEVADDLVTWMGYHDNWDAEIFYLNIRNLGDGADLRAVQLTSNEEDDRDPKTGGGKIVWVAEKDGETHIMLATP